MTHSGNQNNEKKSVKYNSLYANIPSTSNGQMPHSGEMKIG